MTSYNKLPKTLERIDPKIISVNAKYIYTLMLDRYNLSQKNQWIDADGNIYLYFTLFDVQKAIGVSEKTAIKVLKELENNGLIIRKRQGQGNPARTYLSDPELENTKLSNNTTEKKLKEDKKCKKDTATKNEVIPEAQKEEKNTEIAETTETFKRFFGREPDKSFKTTIEKRLKEKAIIKELLTQAIEKAYKSKAKNPEAFVLYLLGTQQEPAQQPEPKQNKQETTQQELERLKWYLEIAESMGDDNLINTYKKMIDDLSHSEPLRATL